jgi:hypothetical protein
MTRDLYIDQISRDLSLSNLKSLFVSTGAERLFLLRLAPNDNSKNQIYLGGKPDDFHPIPTGTWKTLPGNSQKGDSSVPRFILQAPLSLWWLDVDGVASHAPSAKVILYPQYGRHGEFRLSGFLERCERRPSTLFNGPRRREPGRVLFLGVTNDRRVLGFAAGRDATAAREIQVEAPIQTIGVLGVKDDRGQWGLAAGSDATAAKGPGVESPIQTIGALEELSLPARPPSVLPASALLTVIGDIHRQGWMPSEILLSSGVRRACVGRQSIGQTLLCALGVPADGRDVPDYKGWEVKSFTVQGFQRKANKAVSLMTNEPTGGFYARHGVAKFLKKYGWPSKTNEDRLSFTGPFRLNKQNQKKPFRFVLEGYEPLSGKYTDLSGGLRLYAMDGEVIAEWNFARLMEHWHDKHNNAVYVPAVKAPKGLPLQFWYGPRVHLAAGNPFNKFLDALIAGAIYYDPAPEIIVSSGKVRGRNQLRALIPATLPALYNSVRLNVSVG